jgi:hypothetical protein
LRLYQLEETLSESGITHIEDLQIDTLINSLRNFEKFEISEKIDGSNLQFGYDEQGFYTSRETKMDSPRIRAESDYPVHFGTTFQRSAHLALEQVFPLMKKSGYLKQGDAVDIEVLFRKLPNAVPYDSDTNRIVFLRPTKGNPNIAGIKKLLDGKTVTVTIDAPYTIDGKEIRQASETHVWQFVQTPTVSGDSITKTQAMQEINSKLDELEHFLKADSGIYKFSNAEVLSLPLNKRPEGVEPKDWKDLKLLVKQKRQELEPKIYYHDADTRETGGFKHQLKELLLNNLVRKVRSAFGPAIEDGGWIEGVVFRNKDSGEMFKVVDKDMFNAVKDFLWKVRTDLKDKPRSLKNVESFVGKLLVSMAASLGHPELGTTGAKRHLKKFGNTAEEIIANAGAEVKFENTKSYWENLLAEKQRELNNLLDKYNEERNQLKFSANNRNFDYKDEEVHSRTIQDFAAMSQTLKQMIGKTRQAKTVSDLFGILVGRQLGEI